MIRKLLLVGGDRRALDLEALLRREGFSVHTLGLHTGDEQTADIGHQEALLFSYPFSAREGCVPTMTGMTLHPGDVLAKAKPGALVLAGRGMAEAEGFQLKHYEQAVGLEARNAEISAEAAVCEAMQRMDVALMDASVAVVGYGLFGRALAKRLHLLGAEVWAAARREEQRLVAAGDGMHPISIDALHQIFPKVQIVLNTVPAQVMGERELKALQPGSWLLELASAPYGFDRKTADKMHLRCDVLPALPARYAPRSAALALKEAVLKLLKEAE